MTGCLCILTPFPSVLVLCSLPGFLKTITKGRGQMSEQSRTLKGLSTQSTLLVLIISIERSTTKIYNHISVLQWEMIASLLDCQKENFPQTSVDDCQGHNHKNIGDSGWDREQDGETVNHRSLHTTVSAHAIKFNIWYHFSCIVDQKNKCAPSRGSIMIADRLHSAFPPGLNS